MSETVLLFIINAAVSLSGWGALTYQHYTSKPRVRGKIFQILRGQVDHGNGTSSSTFFTCLHLTNGRHNAVTILDFEMEVEMEDRWYKLERPYGIPFERLNFHDSDGVRIPFTDQQMIYAKGTSLEFGRPLQGWIMFAGPRDLYEKKAKMFRVTCRDEFDEKHSFTTAPEKFENLGLLMELTGMRLTPALAAGPQRHP